jgi:hypothetical protein
MDTKDYIGDPGKVIAFLIKGNDHVYVRKPFQHERLDLQLWLRGQVDIDEVYCIFLPDGTLLAVAESLDVALQTDQHTVCLVH